MIIKQEVLDMANIMKTIKWTYETCMEEAKKYSYRNEFRKNAGGAYNVAKRNNWLDDYTWFINGNLRTALLRTKWTYDACYNVAKKCKTSGEFEKRNASACVTARRKGWIKDYTWFENGNIKGAESRTKWTYDACYNVAKKCKTRTEFMTNYPAAYSAACKKGYLSDYIWLPVKKVWNYETCYEAAKECKTKVDFSKKYSRGYNVAWQNKWLNDYTWFENGNKRIRKWTREACMEEAKKYNGRGEFRHKSCSAYNSALKNGWLNDYTWFEKRLNDISKRTGHTNVVYAYIFTEYNAIYVGRTNNIKRRDKEHIYASEKENLKSFCILYDIALPEVNILESGLSVIESQDKEDYYKKLYKKQGYYIINKAKTGKGVGSIGAIGFGKWTYDNCYNIAKEYETSNAFKTNYPNVYSAACKKGWLKDYTWFKNGRTIASKLRIKWTREACMKEAKKYKTSSEFWNNNTSAYTIARRNGWLKDYTWFPVKKVWNYETCYEAAKECKTRTEFSKKYSRGYNVAWQNKWLNDYTWFKKLRAS